MLIQRKLADYLVGERKAHYHFTVKGNQPTLLQDIARFFQDRNEPDFVEYTPPDHGRIEIRKIWTTTALNHYLDFPHVAQAFVIKRETLEKKTGKGSHEIAYGITSRPRNRPMPDVSFRSTAGIGPSKIVATTSSIGITTKTEAVSAPATAQRTSPACDASPSVSSSPKASTAWRRK